MNIVAELVRFGDREFYKDWWNAKTVEEVLGCDFCYSFPYMLDVSNDVLSWWQKWGELMFFIRNLLSNIMWCGGIWWPLQSAADSSVLANVEYGEFSFCQYLMSVHSYPAYSQRH